MGTFGDWQPEYQARGIATFPVRIVGGDKKPAVSNYLKLGTRASGDLARKFSDSPAFGLALKRNGFTVLDVDTDDDRVLIEAMDRHGPSPFIVRSGSGNKQAWYRHNGERRSVRPVRGVPIDILGDGYVVAPPSEGAKARYEIIQGTLDDLRSLPVLKGLSDPTATAGAAATPAATAMPPTLKGSRDDTLWRHLMVQARHVEGLDELIDIGRYFNDTACIPPLPDAQVIAKAKSAWGYTDRGENRIGRKGAWIDKERDGPLITADQDLFLLKSYLAISPGTRRRILDCEWLGKDLRLEGSEAKRGSAAAD